MIRSVLLKELAADCVNGKLFSVIFIGLLFNFVILSTKILS